MADISEKIEKQMEGTHLALAAVAEVLQKMDGRLAKEEQAVAAAEAENANAAARADLVKSIAKEVIGLIKEGSEAGLDVDGGERKAKATGGTPQNADDSESAVTPTTKIEDQQNTIQAMKKEDGEDEEEEIEKEGDEEEADEEAADVPVEEKGMDEDDEDESDEMKSMAKQIAKLQKELEATKGNMQKAVTAEAESRLRKMGFREETGLQAPKVVKGLGLDDTPIIQKGEGDTAGQLAELSYSELRRLQHQIETGNTDGVPRELLG